jgi:hypothetical protein
VRRLRLQAPGGRIGAPEAEVAGLVVSDQHPVSSCREQPGHGEVGRVITRAKPLRRDDLRDQGTVTGHIWPVRDEVLDLIAPLINRIGALPEPEEPLRGPSVEADPDCGHPARLPSHRRRQVDDSVSVGLDSNLDPPGRVGGLELRRVAPALDAARRHSGSVEPALCGAEAERPGGSAAEHPVLAQDESAGSIRDREVPRVRVDRGPNRPRPDLRGRHRRPDVER